jgi:uncharacterized membrane protein SirB2
MSTLYLVHVSCALLSISGFALRGYWMLTQDPRLQHRAAKTLPHVLDTLLLGSAVAILFQWGVSPFALPWLTAKIIALLVYIGLGMVALRFGSTRRVRVGAWLLALLSAGYIVSVALSKSAWGFALPLLG